MVRDFVVNIDWQRNIPILLESISEIGIGIVFLSFNIGSVIGYGFVLFGIIQLIRKVKTFHLSSTTLTIKRPLFPLKLFEESFCVDKIDKIEFIDLIGRGPYIKIYSIKKDGGFILAASKNKITEFESALLNLGIEVSRKDV